MTIENNLFFIVRSSRNSSCVLLFVRPAGWASGWEIHIHVLPRRGKRSVDQGQYDGSRVGKLVRAGAQGEDARLSAAVDQGLQGRHAVFVHVNGVGPGRFRILTHIELFPRLRVEDQGIGGVGHDTG